jgi:hypothetical protein
MPAGFHDPMVFLDVGVGHCSSWRRGSSWSGPRLLALGATAAFVDGRGSRLGVGRMPLAGAGAPAASGSRSWCRRRRCRARRWRPPHRWWPGRRRAAPRTAAAAPRSAGPGPGRAKSPPEQVIEQVFGTESGMLPTATGWTAGGTLGGTKPRPARVNSGQSWRGNDLVDGSFRRCAAGRKSGRLARLRRRFDP